MPHSWKSHALAKVLSSQLKKKGPCTVLKKDIALIGQIKGFKVNDAFSVEKVLDSVLELSTKRLSPTTITDLKYGKELEKRFWKCFFHWSS